MVKYVGTMVLQVCLIFILLDLLFPILNNNSPCFSHTLLVLLLGTIDRLILAVLTSSPKFSRAFFGHMYLLQYLIG